MGRKEKEQLRPGPSLSWTQTTPAHNGSLFNRSDVPLLWRRLQGRGDKVGHSVRYTVVRLSKLTAQSSAAQLPSSAEVAVHPMAARQLREPLGRKGMCVPSPRGQGTEWALGLLAPALAI